MLTVAEAFETVGAFAAPLAPKANRLDELLDLRLAEAVASDADSPPFDKSLVDGYALIAGDDSPTLRILELVTAGAVPTQRVARGTTTRIMTGAPLPDGADAVVKWEDCEKFDDETIENPRPGLARKLAPGDCVLKRGASFRAGESLLAVGKKLTALDVALLAEVGRAKVAAFPRSRVGVLATGDELVDAAESPGPGQIRNSNGPMLQAAVEAAGAAAINLGVARDEAADLRRRIMQGLEFDVLLVSGGVSAGVKDYVPSILTELGVVEQFHQVRVKPGKPLWFGIRRAGGHRTLVFGLPGNPVSTYVSFKLFVEPALAALAGGPFEPPSEISAVLAAPFKHRGGRPTYHPCRTVTPAGVRELPRIEPLAWRGSADLATLTRADCLGVFAAGDYDLAAESEFVVIKL